MSTILVVSGANLFVGTNPDASKFLTLTELKLPALQAQYQDHMAGGAPVGIEIETGINKLEPTFKLTGVDPATLSQFGLGSRNRQVYTARHVVTDKGTGRKIELKAVIEGRLGKVETDAYKKGDLLATDYAINEVWHYEVWFDRKELVYWDFRENEWRINGISENAEDNQILGIV